MLIKNALSELMARDGLYVNILSALAQKHGTSRIGDLPHFTFYFCGDEIVVTEEHRNAVESAIGRKLVESIGEKPYITTAWLRIPTELTSQVRQAVDAFELAHPAE